jgi:asparagine synthase (glutamine-hydrolysing)
MCGITGYFDPELDPRRGALMLRAMCDVIAHRGPDDEGYAVFAGAGIGMRRLSIIDLAGGHQPQATENQRHIVFNGEVYNFREIRRELIGKGHSFRTDSDTEVVLRQLEQAGPQGIEALNGMFGFAVWDERNRSMFVARDRLGVKPVYYAWNGRRLLIGSEIKALLAAGHPRELDVESLWHYLTFRYVPQPRTIWKGIFKLLPGHSLEISAACPQPVVRRYWTCPGEDESPRSDADWISGFGSLFEDSVRLRLIADVPVGVLLSGGLDSSAVTAAAARLHAGPLKTFSVGYEGRFANDERALARRVASALGTEHSDVEMGDREFLAFLPKLAHFTDEPLADLASVPLFYVSRLAAREVKVVLSGEGSDEVLGGYDLQRAARRWERIGTLRRMPSAGRRVLAAALGRGTRWARMFAEATDSESAWFERSPPAMTNLFTSAEKLTLLRPSDGCAYPESLDLVRDDFRRAPRASRLGQLLHSYRQSWLVEDLLMKADRMTMANSIELRVPFLDYRLVEWAARAPANVKVRHAGAGDWSTKWVLRQYCRGRVPREVIDAPKRGFPLPAYERIATTMRGWARDALAPGCAVERWLDPVRLQSLLAEGTGTDASVAARHRLWAVLVLEMWAREWKPD